MTNTEHWVFGYGSLIFKADFPFAERAPAHIVGWERRFWQGSHDHRGTPQAPGRVVTLVAAPGKRCDGMAYRIDQQVFEHLDHREKNGYARFDTQLRWPHAGSVTGTVYIATPDNHAFLGPASDEAIARQVHESRGPSGCNRDYLLELAQAIRDLDAVDEHIFKLERLLLTYAT